MANPHPKIGRKQLEKLRRDGPAALQWQRRVGLAEARARCTAMVIAGGMPFIGWLWLDWTATTMLLLLGIDIVAVLLADLAKLLIAGAAVRHTHIEDHRTQQILSIVGGLHDGTGRYTDHGRGVSPPGLFAIALLLAAVCALGLYAGLEALGLPPPAVFEEAGFVWMAGGTVLLHLLPALGTALKARRAPPGGVPLYLGCGGVIGLGIGLLVLVWLPLTLGAAGAVLMLSVVFLFRVGFGVFALVWIPRVTAHLEACLQNPPALPDSAQR